MARQDTIPDSSHEKARRRFWIGCAITAFLLVIFPLSMFAFWSDHYSRRVNQKIAQIAKRGEPVFASQLNTLYLLKPDDEDVTELWRQSFNTTFEPDGQQWFELLYRKYGKDGRAQFLDHLPREGESWPDLALAESYLQKHQSIHDQFHQAARRGGHARWRIDYNELNRVVPQVDRARRCLFLLKAEFFVRAKQGDTPACAKCLKTMLAIRNALIHEPCFTTQYIANKIDQEAFEVLALGLCVLPYSDRDLSEIQSSIRSRKVLDNLRLGMTSVRAEGYSAMTNYRSMGEENPWIPATSFDIDFYLESMNEYLEALESPASTAMQKMETIDARVTARADKSKPQFSLAYSSLFLLPKAPYLQHALTAETKQLAADTGIAIEHYRRENGKLPTTLDALVPKHLPSVPTDPFSGKPMLYKLNEKGFTIYSVGKNKTDDGGALDPKTGDEGLHFPTTRQ